MERKIKVLESNSGTEFKPFVEIMQNNGIIIRHSCPYTSVQNGRVERKHRQVVEMGLSMIALSYWADAFPTVARLINRLPTTALKGKIPYSVLFGKNPYFKDAKIFGCAGFPYLKPYNKHKMSFHSVNCVYLGPSMSHKGFKCLSSIGKVYISRHVIFNEGDFPFRSQNKGKKYLIWCLCCQIIIILLIDLILV